MRRCGLINAAQTETAVYIAAMMRMPPAVAAISARCSG
jgi:hypothetical protein